MKISPAISDGIERLRTKWPQSHFQIGKHGEYLIIIPSVMLPRGYKQTICTVLFIAPPGFPSACPDHFFTDIDIELDNGNSPKNTNRWHPELKNENYLALTWPAWGRAMWWSWHLQAWNANHDGLYTYMRVIERRLCSPAR